MKTIHEREMQKNNKRETNKGRKEQWEQRGCLKFVITGPPFITT